MTATATRTLRDSLRGLEASDKAAAIMAAGYVRANGKPNWTAFYEAVLAEMPEKPCEMVQLMGHFINTYGQEFSPTDLSEYWAVYKEQVQIDDSTDGVDSFCETYGLEEIDNYSNYADVVNDYSQEVADAFCKLHDVSYINYLADCYLGTYKSESQFAEEYISDMGNNFPFYVIIDWQATWDQSLRHDFDFDNETGAVFCSSF